MLKNRFKENKSEVGRYVSFQNSILPQKAFERNDLDGRKEKPLKFD